MPLKSSHLYLFSIPIFFLVDKSVDNEEVEEMLEQGNITVMQQGIVRKIMWTNDVKIFKLTFWRITYKSLND